MPKHRSYLEPFFGSGGVLFNKPPAWLETINDLDGEVVNFFRVCRSKPDELANSLALTPWSREERNAAYTPAEDELEQARKFAVKCWQTIWAFPDKARGWRYTTGQNLNSGPKNVSQWAKLPDRIRAAAERLLEVQIENRPALDVIRRFNGAEVLIYADPLYIRKTRTACGNLYTYEMTDADHTELLTALLDHQGMVMLSGYDNELYNDMLSGWRKETRTTQAERGAKRVECLWMNI